MDVSRLRKYIKEKITFFVLVTPKNMSVAVKNPVGRKMKQMLCQAAWCIVQQYNKQPKTAALPNLAWLSVETGWCYGI